MAHRQILVYLDTSVLANWLLLYRKSKKIQLKAEKRALQCMELLKEIRSGKYCCKFIISPLALAELSQSARDAVIAVKIIRDGLSLNWFNRLKKRYSLSYEEQNEIMKSIGSFYAFLSRLGIDITTEQPTDYSEIARISLKHSLEIHDSTHIVKARQEEADYLVTIDPDFSEAQPKISGPEVIKPLTLGTIPRLRQRTRQH